MFPPEYWKHFVSEAFSRKPLMTLLARLCLTLTLCLPLPAFADMLKLQTVTGNVFALVGPKVQRSPENLGNNATFGVVVTDEGVVLIDPGGSWKGAKAIHDKIRKITDKPVRIVVNTGGQDHRWLGNGYWKAQGAQVIASQAAVADQKDRGSMQLTGLATLIGNGLAGTEPSHADITFDEFHSFSLGGLAFEIHHKGQAHTPGDSFVWLADRNTMFTGDIVYVERMLNNGSASNAKSWIAAFEAMAALEPKHIVPGHGSATTLAHARADTYDYLVHLRSRIGALIEDGGEIMDASGIDQSAFSHLEQFDSLAGRNAQSTYEQMEWE